MIPKKLLTALVLAPLAAAALPALAAPRYTVTALPSGTNPSGINNAGQIVGDMDVGGVRHGFVWSISSLLVVGTLGGPDSVGTAINNQGHIAGYANVASGDNHAYTYAGGTLTDLDVFGSATSFSYALAINDVGQVAGGYYSPATGTRAFLHSGGSAIDLGSLGGFFTSANGINSAGHVVGISGLDASSPYPSHAFLYADGIMTDLGTMGGASLSEATAINDSDQVTGYGWVNGSEHAFLYQGGMMNDLGTLGGRYSYGRAINEHGQVVGNANDPSDSDYFAFLYAGGTMTNLNTLIDPALGWTLINATGINAYGQIAAYGCRSQDECGAVLLAPIPEPGTAALLLAGLSLLGWRRGCVPLSAACPRA